MSTDTVGARVPYPLDEVVLPLTVARRARETPDRPFLHDVEGGALTFGELHERSLLWARALMRAGVAPGEMVVTMLHNTVETYAIWLGIAWAGATEVPVNVDLRGNVLAHQLGLPAAATVIADPSAVSQILQVASAVPSLSRLVVRGPAVPAPIDVGTADELLAAAPADAPRPYADLRMWDVASVLYTSGTTGPSKGVLMPWGQLHAGQMISAASIAAGPSERKVIYIAGPPNHVQSKGAVAAMAILGGEAVVRHAFSGSRFWSEVAEHQVTDTGLIGAMAQFLLSAPPRPDDADTTLTNVLMAPVVPAVDAFNARFGTQVWSAYNMTEISVPTWLPRWEAGDTPNCGPAREGYPFYELRLVDAHDLDVAPGEVGELILRTAVPWTLNSGYLNMPEATAQAWRGGWFHTGDAFRQDTQGRFMFVDRMKDTIRRRGENISSYEVEAEALLHAAVLECAAVAVPADEAEDEIKLVVVPRDDVALDVDDLLAFLSDRLPRYMMPRYVQPVEALPKTPTLRVQKSLISRTVSDQDGVIDRTHLPSTKEPA